MSNVIFPKTLYDDTFCVIVSLKTLAADLKRLSEELQAWLNSWCNDNQVWERHWSDGKIENLVYDEEFVSTPEIVSYGAGVIKIKFRGQSRKSKMWKDWLFIRVIPEIIDDFPEIQEFESIKDCER